MNPRCDTLLDEIKKKGKLSEDDLLQLCEELRKGRKFWKMTANLCQMGLILICTENQFSRCSEQITQRVLSFSVIRL